MDEKLRQLVHRRALERCEYCHLPQANHDQRFSIDHIVPRKHRGEDSVENLALCCLRCNLSKGTNLTGIDPVGNEVTSLFNPRTQVWHEHFRWNGPILIGLTPIGRTTIFVLRVNAPERVQLREMLLAEGMFKID